MQFNLFTLTNTTWDPWLFNHKCWPSNMNHTDHIFCHCHVHFTLSEYLNKHLEQYSSSTCRLVYISSWKLHILLHVSFFSQLYLWLILKSRRGEGGEVYWQNSARMEGQGRSEKVLRRGGPTSFCSSSFAMPSNIKILE